MQWFGLATTLLSEDRPLLELAARSGCSGLLMGFESMSPANLRQSRKDFNSPGEYRALADLLHRHTITLRACFTFGLGDDTPATFLETARFAVEAHIDLPQMWFRSLASRMVYFGCDSEEPDGRAGSFVLFDLSDL